MLELNVLYGIISEDLISTRVEFIPGNTSTPQFYAMIPWGSILQRIMDVLE